MNKLPILTSECSGQNVFQRNRIGWSLGGHLSFCADANTHTHCFYSDQHNVIGIFKKCLRLQNLHMLRLRISAATARNACVQ